jgi:hypothetical protein
MGNNSLPIIAVFPNRSRADAAIDELWHAGFHEDEIGVASPGEELHQATTATGQIEDRAAQGAQTGAVAGGIAGALAGTVAAATIPGFGPILAGGMLLSMVGGAAAGAALGTFAGPFVALGLSSDEARHFETEFRAGRTIVTVQAKDKQEEAFTILHSHGPVSVAAAGTRMSSMA